MSEDAGASSSGAVSESGGGSAYVGGAGPGDSANGAAPESKRGLGESSNGEANGESADSGGEVTKVERHRVKVGKEELDVDLEELKRGYSRASYANRRMEEAALREKEIEALGPEEFLKKRGIDPVKYAEELIYRQLELEQLSPAERERKVIEAERAKLERERGDWQKQRDDAVVEQQALKLRDQYQRTFAEALKTGGVPVSNRTVARVAEVMANALDSGYRVDASQAAEIVREEYEAEVTHFLGELPDEDIERRLGSRLTKIRQGRIDKLRNGAPGTAAAAQQETGQPSKRRTPSVTSAQYFEAQRLGMSVSEYLEAERKGEV